MYFFIQGNHLIIDNPVAESVRSCHDHRSDPGTIGHSGGKITLILHILRKDKPRNLAHRSKFEIFLLPGHFMYNFNQKC